jgi:nucleotide-binding universal stress UspA family protein
MFAHLLVPLDGSGLAERVVPATRAIAGRFGARVTLLHVLERRPPAGVHGDRHLSTAGDAAAYLRALAVREFSGVRVAVHVHEPAAPDVPAAIADHAAELGADVIVLCTHGWGGARALLFGSVAEQVMGRGTTPVLLLRPATAAPALDSARVLVPLDGSRPSEAALAPARAVALVMVVPTVTTVPEERAPAALLLPGATAAALEMEEDAAAAYLGDLVARMRAGGVRATACLERGDPAVQVVAFADRLDVGLVVMATHGRSGMRAVWAGSVAFRIVRGSARPMLLIRAPAPQDAA